MSYSTFIIFDKIVLQSIRHIHKSLTILNVFLYDFIVTLLSYSFLILVNNSSSEVNFIEGKLFRNACCSVVLRWKRNLRLSNERINIRIIIDFVEVLKSWTKKRSSTKRNK
jgi:hypothetical protein